jgi:Flp pilus assembly protein TadG
MIVLRAGRRRSQAGQILPLAAVGFIMLAAIAGLAIDASRDYLIKRDAQNAADFAALAAAKEMTLSSSLSVPIIPNSAPVVAAHDFAANNGFSTLYGNGCDSTAGGGFTTTWFDVGGLPCSATSGFTTRVTVNSPAINLPGSPVPPVCQGSGQFACVQVVISASVAQLFASVIGINRAYVTVGASAHATLPGSNINAPPPNALVLYQPQAGCVPASQQCFNESSPVSRQLLACTGGSNNCPTFWARPGTAPQIYGFDGQYFTPAADMTTLQSNGDMVIQDRTTLCDPYGGATCSPNVPRGARGFAIPGATKLYCQRYGVGAIVGTPCTTTGQATLNELDSNQAGYSPQTYWYPTVDTTGLRACGNLVLNGQAVTGPCANASEPYLIEPGFYGYIVINHGTYEFDQGLFDITGIAPVNGQTGGTYWADGIDHSRESAADFDLCTAGLPNSCSTLSAGVWIGHGGGAFNAYVAPTSGSCAGGFTGANGGGGDATIISGNAVVFRFESSSAGFVSTNEVQGLNLAGAGVNSLAAVGGSPLLIVEENNSFVHIDATASSSNQLQGIIYQRPGATAGGVEVNLGMNNTSAGALIGQVLAYSFTTFGTPGQLNFQNGYGAGTVSGIQTSGKNETSIISSVSLAAASTPGYETLTVNYTDEWAMDAYDQFIKVNNGQPIFFSQGIWTGAPGPGAPLPPPTNNPGDQFPAYPSGSSPGSYTIKSMSPPDWVYAIPNSNNSTIEVSGKWIWGHEKDIPGASQGPNPAVVKYTFPIPSGSYVAVSVFVSDGDRCGDYAYGSHTFRNTGGPGPGQQVIGGVDLAQ